MRPIYQAYSIVLLAGVSLVALPLLMGATSGDYRSFTDTHVLQDSVSAWQYLQGGGTCRIVGTFGGASVKVETWINGTESSTDPGPDCAIEGTVVVCPAGPRLLGFVKSTDWLPVTLGYGAYRINVTGGDDATDLTFHCRAAAGA